MIKVILTAVGCPGGPSIIQALREDKNVYIIGTDVRSEMVGKYIVDEFYTIPKGVDPGFIPFMLELAKKTNADVILPLATFELLNFSKNLKEFENINVKVCVSNYSSLLTANDKSLLYSKFRRTNFVPKFKILKDGNKLLSEARSLGYPENKVVIKPFISHGSIGLRIIDNKIDLYSHYRTTKPNSTFIPESIAVSILENQKFNDILLSEFVPGDEMGIDLLVHPETHKIVDFVVRSNGEVFHSEISNGKIIEDPRLIEIAKKITTELNLAYTINIDFKMDQNGNPIMLEINPRLPATSFLALCSGLNLPLNSIYLALGKPIKRSTKISSRNIFSYRGFVVTDENQSIVNKAL